MARVYLLIDYPTALYNILPNSIEVKEEAESQANRPATPSKKEGSRKKRLFGGGRGGQWRLWEDGQQGRKGGVVPPPPREGGDRCSVAGLTRGTPPLQGAGRLTLRRDAHRHSLLGAGAPIQMRRLPVLSPAEPCLHTAPQIPPCEGYRYRTTRDEVFSLPLTHISGSIYVPSFVCGINVASSFILFSRMGLTHRIHACIHICALTYYGLSVVTYVYMMIL